MKQHKKTGYVNSHGTHVDDYVSPKISPKVYASPLMEQIHKPFTQEELNNLREVTKRNWNGCGTFDIKIYDDIVENKNALNYLTHEDANVRQFVMQELHAEGKFMYTVLFCADKDRFVSGHAYRNLRNCLDEYTDEFISGFPKWLSKELLSDNAIKFHRRERIKKLAA